MELNYFKKQIKAIKDFLKSDHKHSEEARSLIVACENGDIEAFKKQYSADMKLIDHSSCL